MTLVTNQKIEQGDHGRSFYAFLISFVAAVGGFLYGYDLVIISGAQIFLKEQFQLRNAMFAFTNTSAILGCITGPFLSVLFCDRIGRRNTLIFSAILFGLSAVGTAIPKDIITFNIFRFIGGIGVGLCSIGSPMYIAEVAPFKKRGALGIMFQLAIVVGALISSIVAWFLAKYLAETIAWRWMFASEIVPIIGFVIFLSLIPKTPRWLAEKGRYDEALNVIVRIEGPENARKEIEEIKESLSMESGKFSEIFQPGIRWALLIGIFLALFNNLTGWSAMGMYLPTLFQKAGFSEISDAILQFVIINTLLVTLTLVSIWLVDRVGRRPLWIYGSIAMIPALILIGLIFQFKMTGIIVLLSAFLCSVPHAMALGPLPWLMMSELYPTRIRAKAVAITTTVLWIAGFTGPFAFPILTGFSERVIGSVGGAFWLFAFICILSLIFGIKMLPETKGRTLEEIAESWTKS